MSTIRETSAGALTHAEIGREVGVTTKSGAYIRDVLVGVIYGIQANRPADRTASSPKVYEDLPLVLLAFENALPADRFFDDRSGRYFEVEWSAPATVYPKASSGSATDRSAE